MKKNEAQTANMRACHETVIERSVIPLIVTEGGTMPPSIKN